MTNVVWKSQKNSNQLEKSYMIVETGPWQVRIQSHVWSPPSDIFEIEDSYVIRVEIAGMRHMDFTIQLDDNYLMVWGIRRDRPERRAYHQMEVRFGEFSTVVAIPGPVRSEDATAEYNDGFLTITLPKIEPK